MKTSLFDAASEVVPAVAGYPCVISPCGQYRYILYRVWNVVAKPRLVLWCCLNPSVADAEKDDASLRRMMGYGRAWGYDGIVVANAFGFRSKDPKEMKAAADPIGDATPEAAR